LDSADELDSRSPVERDVLQVRRFATGDARAVHTLDDSAMNAASARGRRDANLDSIAAAYLDDGGDFLVGVCDGRLVATGALRHVTDVVAELERMRTHPAQRLYATSAYREVGRGQLAGIEVVYFEKTLA
jgi:hypothetical protein